MIDHSPLIALINRQQQQLELLLSLLQAEFEAISIRDINRLEQNCSDKMQLIEQIQQLDEEIAAWPALSQVKTAAEVQAAIAATDEILARCKQQNELNQVTLEQSQLILSRFKDELLKSRGKSGLTYTAKGKPAIDAIGKGIKA